MNNKKVLIPDYYNIFKCIGGECEDTCCNGWRILVDESTYDCYKKIDNEKLGLLFKNNVHRNKNYRNSSDYGIIDLKENGDCIFLSEKKLCKIHSNLGQNYMCRTCRDYPRHYNYVDKVIEKSLSLSCPEACRQILFRDNQITFFTEEENLKEITIHGSLNTSEFKNDSEKYFWDIRIFTIQVLQTRELTIEERMGVLALFFYEISNGKNNNISDIIINYKNDIQSGKYCGFIQDSTDMDNKTKMQLIFILRICGNVLNKISSPGYFNNLKLIVKGLNLDGNESYDILKSTYINTKKGVYNSFILENSTVYENYLVNYVYKTLFPKTDVSLFDIYLNLLLNFSILRFNIIGLCAYYGSQMDKDKLVYLVSNFARMTEHASEMTETLNRFAYANNLNNLHDILLLIGQ